MKPSENNTVVCLVDNTEYDSVEIMHMYLRKIKLSQKDYYEKYCPKFDLYSNAKINFINYEQYTNADFGNINNLKKWLKENPEKGKEWAENWFKKRIKEKSLTKAPSQVELKSLFAPTWLYFNHMFGYEKLCSSLGLKVTFPNNDLTENYDKDSYIIIDTREQKPLNFPKNVKVVKEKVDEGDYSIGPINKYSVYIERKSLLDLIGTMSSDLERFKREIDRAKESGSYIVVLVEQDFSFCFNFDKLKNLNKSLKYVKANAAFIFKRIRDVMMEYDNIQFLFVDGRKEASIAVTKIFALGEKVKLTDLQFQYDSDKFKI